METFATRKTFLKLAGRLPIFFREAVACSALWLGHGNGTWSCLLTNHWGSRLFGLKPGNSESVFCWKMVLHGPMMQTAGQCSIYVDICCHTSVLQKIAPSETVKAYEMSLCQRTIRKWGQWISPIFPQLVWFSYSHDCPNELQSILLVTFQLLAP